MGRPLPKASIKSISQPSIPGKRINQKIDLWVFSFKYFKQIEYFGFDRTEPKWFVSMLERLRDLSGVKKDEFIRNAVQRDDYRYHKIDWNATSIPIQKSQLDWIDKDVLKNDDEFPFYQFHIAKALGRVVGFWDSSTFHIVLFDPLHNIQPSKYNDYKVRDNYPLSCEYTSLLLDLETLKKSTCHNIERGFTRNIHNMPTGKVNQNLVIAFLDDDFYTQYKLIITKQSFTSILENGIMGLA